MTIANYWDFFLVFMQGTVYSGEISVNLWYPTMRILLFQTLHCCVASLSIL